MELIKEKWTNEDGKVFQNYLKSLSQGKEKGDWEQRIINTEMECIAVPSPVVERLFKEILKGNFKSFVDLWLWDYYTNTAINGKLICKIKDFDLFKSYLIKYANMCDNWASVDCLKFDIKENTRADFFALSKELISSNKPFVRRVGNRILFKLIDDNDYIEQIFEVINLQTNEEEYYVNMVIAWLIAECFTKQRERTIEFLNIQKLNKFTINKAISKCRDSFRVSKADKEMLLKYRK